jgi:hypothetical protein
MRKATLPSFPSNCENEGRSAGINFLTDRSQSHAQAHMSSGFVGTYGHRSGQVDLESQLYFLILKPLCISFQQTKPKNLPPPASKKKTDPPKIKATTQKQLANKPTTGSVFANVFGESKLDRSHLQARPCGRLNSSSLPKSRPLPEPSSSLVISKGHSNTKKTSTQIAALRKPKLFIPPSQR